VIRMKKDEKTRFQARVSNEFKHIIDDFLKAKNMTQAEFIEKYFPALFMALDEKLYFELYEKYYRNENMQTQVEKRRENEYKIDIRPGNREDIHSCKVYL